VPAVKLLSADLLVLSYMKCVLPAISSVPLPPANISDSFSRICYRHCESLETPGGETHHFYLLVRIYNRNYRFIRNLYSYEAIPLQAWTGPEGSRRLGLPDFKTVVSLTHRPPLPPRKYSWYLFLLEA
jgi:hypothetical protein